MDVIVLRDVVDFGHPLCLEFSLRVSGILLLLNFLPREHDEGQGSPLRNDELDAFAQDAPCPRPTRMNEVGDAVPDSQDSITRGVQNLQLADVPATQPDHADRPPLTMSNSQRLTEHRLRH